MDIGKFRQSSGDYKSISITYLVMQIGKTYDLSHL